MKRKRKQRRTQQRKIKKGDIRVLIRRRRTKFNVKEMLKENEDD